LKNSDDIHGLLECRTISILDLSNNCIDDPSIIDILEKLTNLRVLYLRGNDVCGKISNYRKTLISRIKSLTHLDDRPVFEDERRCCNAWAYGGTDAERIEREKINKEKSQRDQMNFMAMQELMDAARQNSNLSLHLYDDYKTDSSNDTDQYSTTSTEQNNSVDEINSDNNNDTCNEETYHKEQENMSNDNYLIELD